MLADVGKSTIGRLFLQSAKSFELRRFIYRPHGSSITYFQAVFYLKAYVKHLMSLKVRKGDPIICYCEEPEATLFFFLAAQFLGAIPVPVSSSYSENYVKQLAIRTGARFVFLGNRKLEGETFMKTIEFPQFDHIVTGTRINYFDAIDYLGQIHESIKSENIVMMQPTPSPQGVPRLIIRQHKSLTHFASHIADEVKGSQLTPPRYLFLYSAAYANFYHHLTTALAIGAELAIPTQIEMQSSLLEVHELNPTIIALTPRILKSLVAAEKTVYSAEKKQFLFPTSNQFIIISGGLGEAKVLSRLQKEGAEILQTYALPETSLIAYTPKDQWLPNSYGRIVNSVQHKFDYDQELLVKSVGLMINYSGDMEANKLVMTADGYFKTGDICHLNSEGLLEVRAQKKDIFETPDGVHLYPSRIEDLLEHAVLESQVILLGDGRPYLTALIALSDAPAEKMNEQFLSPESHRGLYENLAKTIRALNGHLENSEKIVRFFVFAKGFPPSCYQVDRFGVTRNREVIETLLVPIIIDLSAHTDFELTHVGRDVITLKKAG